MSKVRRASHAGSWYSGNSTYFEEYSINWTKKSSNKSYVYIHFNAKAMGVNGNATSETSASSSASAVKALNLILNYKNVLSRREKNF